jgi:hypothetical protein
LLAVAACVGLALLNWRVLDMEIDTSPVTPPGASNEAALAAAGDMPPAPSAAATAAFPETLARPLFRSNRRPPAAKPDEARTAAKTAKPAVALPTDLKLIGIVKEKGQAERALIRSGASADGQWLQVGQIVEGWRLARIDDSGIVFEANGEERNLSLFPKSSE